MEIVGADAVDILLNDDFQPVAGSNGDFQLAAGDACWQQDLRMEAVSEENELFYEDDNDVENYGFGMRDFLHCEEEEDGSLGTEIEARIKDKLAKREYIDHMSVQVNVDMAGDVWKAAISLKKKDEDAETSLELTIDNAEVVVAYD